ncbi:hypothetical protein B0H16DRAFT_1644279 [Mycena metata]|uniref:Uncharacterized protein n=1 Tax=Mycena metata TaxID=1033252 RepID=A0AAD7GPH3_9AGAR|nr:hypothetical protein B0H16DRAFT_1644279 [Mycena metata]
MDDPTLPGFLWGLFVCDLFETSATIFFYGLYVNLFILAIYTLQRRRTYGRIWLLAASWMLFVVGTLQTILRVMISTVLGRAVALLVAHGQGELPTAEIIGLVRDRLGLELADNAVFAVNVFITDSVFLYRCYLVWGYRVKPVLLPGILILATIAMAIVSLVEGSSSSDFVLLGGRLQIMATTTAYGLGLAANVLLMALTAGRIWWMRRTIANIPGLHSSIDTRFSAVISIILESGSIYCFSAFLLAITLTTVGSSNNFYSVLVGIAYQAVNIAPTLTVVRVGLGHNIEDAVKRGFTQPPEPIVSTKLDGCSPGSQMVDLHPNLDVERFGVANMLGSA